MSRRRQAGASGGLILVVLVLIMVGVLATYALSRFSSSGGSQAQTSTSLLAAASALEQYAAVQQRLPCPADPAIDTGDEDPPGGGACNFAGGTIPWRTIGLRRDDSIDAWGRKLSYRVYTGAAGSLTQVGGVSMVECDITEPLPAKGTAAGGLCRTNPDIYQRDTTPAEFFLNKGLSLNDSGTPHGDVAYVIVSHGATGLGGYTVSGARLDTPLPKGDELDNTKTTGPFVIRAFSDVEVAADAVEHFDDVLAYRTLPELVRRINLGARDWPETVTTGEVFDNPTVAAAVGDPVSPGSLGQATVDFGTASVSGFTGTDTATNLSYDVTAGTGGIGVAGGVNNRMSSFSGEWMRIDLDARAASFAVTLNHFGRFSSSGDTFTERVELRFYANGVPVGSPVVKSGCRADGGLASFSIASVGSYDSVDIRPLTSTEPGGGQSFSSFLVSAFNACSAATTTCATALAAAGNNCS